MSNGVEIGALADRLTILERGLLIGAFENWGSWMWSVGNDLCRLGLMKRDGANIVHTQLGRDMAEYIRISHKSLPVKE